MNLRLSRINFILCSLLHFPRIVDPESGLATPVDGEDFPDGCTIKNDTFRRALGDLSALAERRGFSFKDGGRQQTVDDLVTSALTFNRRIDMLRSSDIPRGVHNVIVAVSVFYMGVTYPLQVNYMIRVHGRERSERKDCEPRHVPIRVHQLVSRGPFFSPFS